MIIFRSFIFLASTFFLLNYCYAEEYNLSKLKEDFIEINEELKKNINNLPKATSDLEKNFDEAITTLYLSMNALSKENINFEEIEIFDQLNIFESLVGNIAGSLPKEISHNMDDLDMEQFSSEEKELLSLTMSDLKQIKLEKSVELSESITRINQTSFEIEATLEKFEKIDQAFAIKDFEKFKKDMASELNIEVDTLMTSAEKNISITSNNNPKTNIDSSINLADSNQSILEVSQVTEEVSQVTEEVSQVTEEISQVTEEVSQVTEEISQVTEEVSQVTEEISQVAEEVSQVAESINEVVSEITEATSEIAEAASSITEEASALANWISSGKFDMSLATNFATHVDWDSWEPGNYDNYQLEHQSNEIIEAMAEVNDAINCSDGTCVFDDWKDVRDLEDYQKIMQYCDNKPEHNLETSGFSVYGVRYKWSDCP